MNRKNRNQRPQRQPRNQSSVFPAVVSVAGYPAVVRSIEDIGKLSAHGAVTTVRENYHPGPAVNTSNAPEVIIDSDVLDNLSEMAEHILVAEITKIEHFTLDGQVRNGTASLEDDVLGGLITLKGGAQIRVSTGWLRMCRPRTGYRLVVRTNRATGEVVSVVAVGEDTVRQRYVAAAVKERRQPKAAKKKKKAEALDPVYAKLAASISAAVIERSVVRLDPSSVYQVAGDTAGIFRLEIPFAFFDDLIVNPSLNMDWKTMRSLANANWAEPLEQYTVRRVFMSTGERVVRVIKDVEENRYVALYRMSDADKGASAPKAEVAEVQPNEKLLDLMGSISTAELMFDVDEAAAEALETKENSHLYDEYLSNELNVQDNTGEESDNNHNA